MISYCTTVYNEKEYIKTLLDKFTKVLQEDEEIVVIQTYREISEQKENWYQEITEIVKSYPIIYGTYHFMQNNYDAFPSLKNHMNTFATKPYIFNLDSDEDYPEESFDILRDIVRKNNFGLVYIPRINTVDGLTDEDIKKWNWHVNEFGWINWPDYQPRLYKNTKNIQWTGGPHCGVIGASDVVGLDSLENFAIIHKKDIARQRDQNELYDKVLADTQK
jgi:hypothetical protein